MAVGTVEGNTLVTPPRLLFLCKRYYMRKDVVVDRYGRLEQFPAQFRASGWQVTAHALEYRLGGQEQGQQSWRTFAVEDVASGRYWRECLAAARSTDVVLASSDALHVVAGARLARAAGIPFVADLYDNYEAFGLTHLPFLRGAYRKALREAVLVTCVSEALADHVARDLGAPATLFVPSTITEGSFFPRERDEARRELGLPGDKQLIGLAGGLDRRRGAMEVISAIRMLHAQNNSIRLVLAGNPPASVREAAKGFAELAGPLPHEKMNAFYNAMDVNIVHVVDDSFGRYSFPQKFYEILATRRPLVASRVGVVAELLGKIPQLLYTPASISELAGAVRHQLATPAIPDMHVPAWREVLSPLLSILNELTEK